MKKQHFCLVRHQVLKMVKINGSRLKDVLHKAKCTVRLSKFKENISKIALVASFIVYYSKSEQNWNSPAFISYE